jgi:hypothetical protein
MSLPRAHIERLHRDLRIHEARLEHLRDQVAHLEEEAAAHEMVIALGRDDRLIDALGELYEDATAIGARSEDPGAFLRSRDIELPNGAQIEMSSSSESRAISVRLTTGRWVYSCVWDSADGFSLKHHTIPGSSPDQSGGPGADAAAEA